LPGSALAGWFEAAILKSARGQGPRADAGVDDYIPTPRRRPLDQAVPYAGSKTLFSISGRGTVCLTGRVEQGRRSRFGEENRDCRIRPTVKTTCPPVFEMSAKLPRPRARLATTLALLRGVDREGVEARPGSLAKPGSINAAHDVRSRGLYSWTKERGWRQHRRFLTNYRPQFYSRTTGRDGVVGTLPGRTRKWCFGRIREKMESELIPARSPWTRVCASPSAKAAGPSRRRVSEIKEIGDWYPSPDGKAGFRKEAGLFHWAGGLTGITLALSPPVGT